MTIGKTAIEAVGVTKIFQSSGQDSLKALDNVSVTIGENEFFTLLGPSGCGKTTVLRLLAGLVAPSLPGLISPPTGKSCCMDRI